MTVKSCDGTYEYILEGKQCKMDKCTLYLHINSFTKDKDSHFLINIANPYGYTIYSKNLSNKNNPKFDDKSFYILGEKIFTVENSSTSRFNDIKKTYESGIITIAEKFINYFDNKYEGEIKNCTPHGNGILYYEKTNVPMIKSNFVNGKLDGKTVLYSKDQNIEIICDDIVNMKPVQYATVFFKNQNKKIQVEMTDFASKHTSDICLYNVDRYVSALATYAVMNDSDIFEPQKFLFLNKKPEQQYEEIFSMLSENKNLIKTHTNVIYKQFKILNYLLILYFPFFLYLLCNMKQ